MGCEEHGGNAQKLRWPNGLSEDGAGASRLGRAVQVRAHCCGLTQDVPFGQQFSSLSAPSAKPTDPQEATAESMVRVWVASQVACSFVGAFRAAAHSSATRFGEYFCLYYRVLPFVGFWDVATLPMNFWMLMLPFASVSALLMAFLYDRLR